MHLQSHKVLMVNMFTHSYVVLLVLQWYDDNEMNGNLGCRIICSN